MKWLQSTTVMKKPGTRRFEILPDTSALGSRPSVVAAFCLILISAASASAETFAVIAPENTELSAQAADAFSSELGKRFKVLDRDLSEAAFRAFEFTSPFNLDLETARNVGAAIGSANFVLLKAGVQRRSKFGRGTYYESHVAVFVIDSATGRMTSFTISLGEEDSELKAVETMIGSARSEAVLLVSNAESRLSAGLPYDPPPELSGKENEIIRPPMPYSRIKPAYPQIADLLGIEATVDVDVAISGDGSVEKVDIIRWAGFGLEESVKEAIRTMRWRPAERDGEFLPMRVLLRYNFRDLEEDPDNE